MQTTETPMDHFLQVEVQLNPLFKLISYRNNNKNKTFQDQT